MRIFIYEYTCGGGMELKSLRTEGWAMLSAVLQDFSRVPGVTVTTILDEGLAKETVGLGPGFRLIGPGEEKFREEACQADYTLVIAPELAGILATRCRWVEEAGGRLLGPSPAAVELTGDKLALNRLWQQQGVPTPDCFSERAGETPAFPAVWKPRFGAGSHATFLVERREQVPGIAGQARAEGFNGEALLQRFVPGRAASVAWLIGPRQRVPLLPAAQRLSTDGRFHYLGGSLPLPADLAGRAVRLAERAIAQLPGLLGYVGVDLVLGEAADGSQDWAIELNPRLTTSYVGQRALARTNLALAMLRLAQGEDQVVLEWQPGSVRFDAAGEVGPITKDAD